MGNSDDTPVDPVERRTLLKSGVAGGVALGLVWSAPRIEGLSLRPDFASASSSSMITITFNDQGLDAGADGSFAPDTGVCGSGDWQANRASLLSAFDIQVRIEHNVPNFTVNQVNTNDQWRAAVAFSNRDGVTEGIGSADIGDVAVGPFRLFVSYDCA